MEGREGKRERKEGAEETEAGMSEGGMRRRRVRLYIIWEASAGGKNPCGHGRETRAEKASR